MDPLPVSRGTDEFASEAVTRTVLEKLSTRSVDVLMQGGADAMSASQCYAVVGGGWRFLNFAGISSQQFRIQMKSSLRARVQAHRSRSRRKEVPQ